MQATIIKKIISGETTKSIELQRFLRVFLGRKVVLLGAIVILLLIITALFAPQFAPYDPIKQNLSIALQHPSNQHLLGTDALGRDILSRIVYGTRVSLAVGFAAVVVGGLLGMTLGMLAGYFGGIIDLLIMRFIDAMMAIPPLLLALVLGVSLGGGLYSVMIALGVSLLPTYARLMRGQVLAVKQADYIKASEVVGCSDFRIMLRHVFPNCLPPLIVLVTLNLGTAILSEASLSFLGLGIAPPDPAWGAMVYDGYTYLLTNPLISIAPGICILLVVLAFNIVGDGIRDALDPRLRGII